MIYFNFLVGSMNLISITHFIFSGYWIEFAGDYSNSVDTINSTVYQMLLKNVMNVRQVENLGTTCLLVINKNFYVVIINI